MQNKVAHVGYILQILSQKTISSVDPNHCSLPQPNKGMSEMLLSSEALISRQVNKK